jgi:hypothetical protein
MKADSDALLTFEQVGGAVSTPPASDPVWAESAGSCGAGGGSPCPLLAFRRGPRRVEGMETLDVTLPCTGLAANCSTFDMVGLYAGDVVPGFEAPPPKRQRHE